MQSINNYVFDDFKSKLQIAEVFENSGFPLNNTEGFDSNDNSIKSTPNKIQEEV